MPYRYTEQQRKATEKLHFSWVQQVHKRAHGHCACGQLIGDRALSWSNNGLHRLADGCRLHLNHSLPISLDKALQFGTIAENLTLTNKRNPTLDDPDNDLSTRTPAHLVVPLGLLNATSEAHTDGPTQLVILTTDPLGVLPPLAKISHEQCLAWFMLGYGNHLGPLEELLSETDVRFTPGFMDTLLPRNLNDYVLILEDLLEKYETRCFLVNAGWHGGQIGQGSLSKSEEIAVIDSMHHCADWRPLGSLGLSIPAEKSDTATVWNPEDRWPESQ